MTKNRQAEPLDFGGLHDQHYDEIYRYIYRNLSHQQTAQDLAGETFLRLLEQVEKGSTPRGNVRAWLFRVAHNLVIDEYRRREHRDHDEVQPDMQAELEPVESQAGRSLMQEKAHDTLERLPDRQRTAVILRYYEGMSYKEIADILDISTPSARVLVHRGLSRLRDYFEMQGLL